MAESGKKHPIRIVARRTGTPETTLRAWERRYGAVRPERAETGRRLYSDKDVERLKLIRQAVDAGRAVSSVARMSDSDLMQLIEEDHESTRGFEGVAPIGPSAADVVDACFAAVGKTDAQTLYSCLNRATVKFDTGGLIDEVITPLLYRIGDSWKAGRLSPRHEHMASSVVRAILTQLQARIHHTGPRTIVLGTPPGQLHDLGTQFAAALAVSEGWNVVNLGADIPASEVVAAAEEVGAGIVGLSIVHPLDDARVEEALEYLGEHLGHDTQLVVGGQGVETYSGSINEAGGLAVQSARAFSRLLSHAGDIEQK